MKYSIKIVTIALCLSMPTCALAACSSNENLKDEATQYLKYIAPNTVGSHVELPTDLREDMNTVSFAGKEGSVEFSYKKEPTKYGNELYGTVTWTSNGTVTHDEFESFKKNIDKHYGYEANENGSSIGNTKWYSWHDDENDCDVVAKYKDGHAVVSFKSRID